MSVVTTIGPAGGILENGVSITFGKSGNVGLFVTSGIDLHDGDFYAWTEKQTAWVEVTARWPAKDLSITLAAAPYLATDKIVRQDVFLHVNGLYCGFHAFFEQAECSFPVPRNAISGRSTKIAITIPTATSPKRLGLSEDIRELGIAITALSLLSA